MKITKVTSIALSALLLTTALTFAQDAQVNSEATTTATVNANIGESAPVKRSFFQSLKEIFTRKKEAQAEIKNDRREMMEMKKEMMSASGTMMSKDEMKDKMVEMKGNMMMEDEAKIKASLAEAVKAGLITQAEADTVIANRAIIKAKQAENETILAKARKAASMMKEEMKGKMMEKRPATSTLKVNATAGANVEVR